MPVENGLLILDKPAGPTSREVVEQVKKMLGVKSAGHVGTLDPNATGVLPILLGRATLAARALERLDKEYVATIHLHKDVSDDELNEALKTFVGTIKQLPPVKSAVARRERERIVYTIGVLGRSEKDVRLYVVCEAGTYIRKIASDLGAKIGGAHLKELRRTRSGPFGEEQAHTLDELQNALKDDGSLKLIILPVEKAVEHIPHVIVKDSAIPAIMNGAPVRSTDVCDTSAATLEGEIVAVMSCDGQLVALGRVTGTSVRVERVIKA